MAQTDLLKRSLDAGVAFTQLTQQRAEAIVKELVKAGEVQAEHATQRRNELMERSRQNTERLLGLVRKEVRDQVRSLGLATQADIASLRREIAALKKSVTATKTTATKNTATKATATKKAPAKKVAR
ncbi:MAG: hypothetical protein QOI47_1736 [Actinomycetota bacterium]|nr:hypothetical protein [Actinomycetota bacterium]